ncbi:5'-3' exoribonuclease [Tieghemostelium lacteum]|uniref:5'-3' exoribonuclease n=1 Tax=Tieghemostelium lacteum TaxID=361077 RepID=A0A151ZBH7_TIELA|nr:5'-3' exoribonuclease [Tieghemostelium lacteum]|eukprot:KYQ91303.1 5'-3' exoribonuclease [Tieghemostelium lacteum]
MGVPRFFRWISERYPQILQKVLESNPPEYDNLYLDMNGIIHACSQETSKLLSFSEDELIRQVCNYVDLLFHTIRPKKLFYMAIDGVAPRSKMNQQRQRRYLAAFNEEKTKRELLNAGKPIPEVEFKRNCITPGTPFMHNLSEALQFYIQKKISEDLSWREVQIIFSGPENPGEGEHKIIDYIRKNKASPDWDSNQTHCIYGLDADLILLSLVTHEPNFSILREEISFKKESSKKPKKEKPVDFQLLHIPILREYLDLELRTDNLSFGYDLERIIDDFTLIMIFFGNDFLPHIPMLEISQGGLNSVLELYRNSLEDLGGYLTNGAEIDLDRLQGFMVKLKNFEQSQKVLPDSKEQEENEEMIEDMLLEHDSLEEGEKKRLEQLAMDRLKQHFSDIHVSEDSTTDRDSPSMYENNYYRVHFQDFPETYEEIKKFKQDLVLNYVEGLSWVLNYYHNGCISWNWHYNYYYAPMAGDFVNVPQLLIQFDYGAPVTPFQQLLSVLPPQSSELLPECYRYLMTSQSSPIVDLYPVTFEIDAQDPHYFDGIAMIGFINHQRLIDATFDQSQFAYTDKEKQRNTLKNAVIIYHDDDIKKHMVPSPNNKIFSDLAESTATTEDIILPIHDSGLKPFRYCDDVLTGVHGPPGFPTLMTQKFQWTMRAGVIDVWGMRTKKDSFIITLENPHIRQHLNREISSTEQLKQLAQQFMSKKCYVNWPYHTEAKIIGFSTIDQMINSEGQISQFSASQKLMFVDEMKDMKSKYLQHGIDLYEPGKKVDYNYCPGIMVHVNKLVGVDSLPGGGTKKRYSDAESVYPIELMVDYSSLKSDPRFEEIVNVPFESRYPVGKKVIYTKRDKYFGCVGTVTMAYDNQLKLDLNVPSQPIDLEFGHSVAQMDERYFAINEVAKLLEMPISHVNLLTGGLYIAKPSSDIGLNLKFAGRQQQVQGYCRGIVVARTPEGHVQRKWEFSKLAVDLMQSYLKEFPIVYKILQYYTTNKAEVPTQNGYSRTMVDITPLFSNNEEKTATLLKIQEFLDRSEIRKKRIVSCDTMSLSKDLIQKIQEHYLAISEKCEMTVQSIHTIADNVNDPLSYESIISYERQQNHQHPGNTHGQNSPGNKSPKFSSSTPNNNHSNNSKKPSNKFRIGDRVLTSLEKGNVPFGRLATVVAVNDTKVDIVFDQECFSANSLEGFCAEKRGLSISTLRLYNLSNPFSLYQKSNHHQRGYKQKSVDPHEFWEKLNSSKDGKLPQDNESIPTHKLHTPEQVEERLLNTSNQEEEQLSWQQLEMLNGISGSQSNNNNNNNNNNKNQQSNKNSTYSTNYVANTLRTSSGQQKNVNYLMKRAPQYTQNNFSSEKEYTKQNPKLPTNFYYDQNGNPVQPPPQKQKKQKSNKVNVEKQHRPVENVDPKKQKQLDFIFQNIKADQNNNSNGGSSVGTSTTPSTSSSVESNPPQTAQAALLLRDIFSSTQPEHSIPPPQYAYPHYPYPHPPPPPPHFQQPYPYPPQFPFPHHLHTSNNNHNNNNNHKLNLNNQNNQRNQNNQKPSNHQIKNFNLKMHKLKLNNHQNQKHQNQRMVQPKRNNLQKIESINQKFLHQNHKIHHQLNNNNLNSSAPSYHHLINNKKKK